MGCAWSRIIAKILFILAFAMSARRVGLLGCAVAVLVATKGEVFRIVAIQGVEVLPAWVSGNFTVCTAASKWCCEL